MLNHQRMCNAYIEAIYFTETGDIGQPGPTAELSAPSKYEAYNACRNFREALQEAPWPIDFNALDAEQLGHDLWFTRNRHGVGFWDRSDVYGKATSELFTMIARAMGEHEVDFVPADNTTS